MDACGELVKVADRIATETSSPREFLQLLGRDAAQIRRGLPGFFDLATGGGNVLKGSGFRRRLDDGTDGQARHFAGIAASAGRVGPRFTRFLSVTVGGDKPTSADGRLTDKAVTFSRQLLRGDLAIQDAGAWIEKHVCAAD
jgi:hypothetical protein